MLDRKISAYKEDGTSLSRYDLINQLIEFRKRLNKAEFDIKSGKYDDITALEVAFLL